MSQKLFFMSLKPAKIRYISLIPNTLSFVTGHFDNAEKYAALSKNKKSLAKYITRLLRYCYRHRSDWIRTSGLLVPNQALYRTEPHPDCLYIISQRRGIVNSIRQKIHITVRCCRYNTFSSSVQIIPRIVKRLS